MDGGCTWQTPQCGQITTVVEADLYVKIHSRECLFNPAVAEENTHRRERPRRAGRPRRTEKPLSLPPWRAGKPPRLRSPGAEGLPEAAGGRHRTPPGDATV